MIEKQYLGDAVYVEVQNGMLLLTTEDGLGGASNRIFLEAPTMENLIAYYQRAKEPKE